MAKTIASGVGMTNDWLAYQDVVSLKSLWASLAPLRRTDYRGPACSVVWGGCSETDIFTQFRPSSYNGRWRVR
jgi:hypothetical protein